LAICAVLTFKKLIIMFAQEFSGMRAAIAGTNSKTDLGLKTVHPEVGNISRSLT
jgi:hypothetical protein